MGEKSPDLVTLVVKHGGVGTCSAIFRVLSSSVENEFMNAFEKRYYFGKS
jgi:hypothetical protein